MRNQAGRELLSPSNYDNDAASLRSPSEQDSDSEDDEFVNASRSTLDLARHDQSVLEEEDEMEKLLTRQGPARGIRRMFSPSGPRVRIGKKERRRARRESRRESRRERVSEEGELMYEMEEGLGDDESLTSGSSMDLDEEDYIHEPDDSKSYWWRYFLAFALILVLLLILLLGAYKASSNFRVAHNLSRPLLSNGTALFAPTTILISLDGFRADFLDRGLTPALNSLIANGVSPQYMNPSFPSVTFPNHFTLVTGLYPESHGIVGNTFWDPELEEEFYYTHPDVSMLPKWWNAEPLWLTAERRGVKSAIHMWPGSEAHIGDMEPTYVDKYNGTEAFSRKVNRVLQLLDLPGVEDGSHPSERPQFIAAYVPDVDRDGHKYGPNSTEIRRSIAAADSLVAEIITGLQSRNLTDIVNIVVVSDHGMATTSNERLIQLDDLIDLSLVDHLDGWPSRGIRPKRPEDMAVLQAQLEKVAPDYTHAFEFYTRETMPERYHFTKNDRIAPLWVIPKTGWAVVERPEFDAQEALKKGQAYHPKGIHGYDHEHPLMRAIFIARGPSFPHAPNSRLEPFQNVEVYNILCDSLGIEPLPSNGTLRLPLKPVGRHSDANTPPLSRPSDPPEPPSTTTAPLPEPTSPAYEAPTQQVPPPTPGSDDEKGPTWWGTVWHKLDEWKQWAGELFSAEKDKHPPAMS
ncbi:Type I phosphodiesterase/nucleotide pyrophosphatase/phosphate transferase [Penicillium chermesinum]|uniref:Type I phosphodiesterase/nucleotide pyrophosphatase/phosphate transferase n=1 Tax=Penicillium chermesinum TaxID=63820 RepID=A0A9W9P0G8_9EURO|nr:Type I phosphodiesterase/nucleotide pyrophosphatase/phosphate transferase [Penicillium chermesinum]KAJ5233087.1 Type I phosphodiesterase/nucleotide pyrophosphatase/phosphate transferase [Penicillium chermesinum]KAJ6172721.1 Type I phosphodiesterase/nucleotide pyrophosphatase/phosphate transferase [Penicillium chermesinum]